jgi:uncharacterized CHY-type Zn-finger protein
LEQLTADPVKAVSLVLVLLSAVLLYTFWFEKKPVEYKRMYHKKISLIFIGVVCSTTYIFFPSDKNMVLLILASILLYLVNTRLVHYCSVCGKTIRTNMLKQQPEQCPYCHSLYTPPGKYG